MPYPQLLKNPMRNPRIPVPSGTPMPPRAAPSRMVMPDATSVRMRPPTAAETAGLMSAGPLLLLIAAAVTTG